MNPSSGTSACNWPACTYAGEGFHGLVGQVHPGSGQGGPEEANVGGWSAGAVHDHIMYGDMSICVQCVVSMYVQGV